MRFESGDEGTQLGLAVRRRLIQALAVPIECDGVILAFTDINRVTLSCVLHCGLRRMNRLACSNSGGKSRHPRYGRCWYIPAKLLSAITSNPPGPVATLPRITTPTGGRAKCWELLRRQKRSDFVDVVLSILQPRIPSICIEGTAVSLVDLGRANGAIYVDGS